MAQIPPDATAFAHRDAAYIPTNLFHLNQNIRPSAGR
jgi:hypothetical protein